MTLSYDANVNFNKLYDIFSPLHRGANICILISLNA